jgi:hypothetical protein
MQGDPAPCGRVHPLWPLLLLLHYILLHCTWVQYTVLALLCTMWCCFCLALIDTVLLSAALPLCFYSQLHPHIRFGGQAAHFAASAAAACG